MALLQTKKAINFWIKQWAEGFKDMMEPVYYYMDKFEGEVPQWVYITFINQIIKVQLAKDCDPNDRNRLRIVLEYKMFPPSPELI